VVFYLFINCPLLYYIQQSVRRGSAGWRWGHPAVRQLHSVIENPTATVFSSSSYLVLFSVCVDYARGRPWWWWWWWGAAALFHPHCVQHLFQFTDRELRLVNLRGRVFSRCAYHRPIYALPLAGCDVIISRKKEREEETASTTVIRAHLSLFGWYLDPGMW